MVTLSLFVVMALAVFCLFAAEDSQRWRDGAARINQQALHQNSVPLREPGSQKIADVPLLLELLGAALEAGLSIPWALRLVAGVTTEQIQVSLSKVVAGLEIGASWEHSWAGVSHLEQVAKLHAALSFAALTGAPAAPLMYAEAQQQRRQAQRDAEKRAASLGVKLVIPLGLCSLPAFVCLGIVPVVIAMIPAL